MALKKCRECGTEISGQAKVCRKCGIKNPVKRTSALTKFIVAILALVAIANIVPRLARQSETTTTTGTPASAPVTGTGASKQQTTDTSTSGTFASTAPSPWHYDKRDDQMQKGTNRFAVVESTNTFSFDRPYSGTQHASLVLRKHVRFGNDVMFQIERGQFVCRIRSCEVVVRFDDSAGQKFKANEADDLTTTVLFIQPFDKFYSAMVKAKRVRIEASVYHEGNQTADFDVSGFDPKQF